MYEYNMPSLRKIAALKTLGKKKISTIFFT